MDFPPRATAVWNNTVLSWSCSGSHAELSFHPAGVIVLAATNRPDVLDSALLRPGRFDRQVTVERPDVQGRIRILKVHSRGKSLGKDVDFDRVARRTPGLP